MKTNVFYGKKVVLFPFDPHSDLTAFIDLHRADKEGMMCKFCLKDMTEEEAYLYMRGMIAARQIHIWTVMTKGKDAKRAGFIYLNDVTSFSASVSGILDTEFVKSLKRDLKRGKYTYAQDALVTMINACFNEFKFDRVESDMVEGNKKGKSLNYRVGFVKEGVMRKAFKIDGQYKDIMLMSILKEEWKNGQERQNFNRSAKLSTAGKS